MSKPFKISLLAGIMLSLVSGSVFAAHVPAGVQLAEKQQIVRNIGSEVVSLDPHRIDGVPEMTVLNDILESLVDTSPDDGSIIPGAAESWETKDNKTWIFHLRRDGKWSNGDPVTADDFVYSFRRLTDPKTAAPYGSYLQYAQVENSTEIINGKKPPESLGVKAIDPYTLEIDLNVPLPYFIKMMAHSSVKPIPRKVIEKYADKWTQPKHWVGNGAYKVSDWVVNERIVLTRNPYYWDNKNTVINQVTYLPIESEVTDVNRYRAGEIDMTYTRLPIELFAKLRKELPNEMHIEPYLCTYYYEFNNQKPPLNNPDVRTALKLALDQDLLTNRVKNQGDTAAYGYTPTFIGNGDMPKPEWATWSQDKRNQEAVKLLTKLGYSKSNPLTLHLLYNTSDLHKKMAIAASSIWKKNLNGLVDIQMQNQEWKTFLDTRRLGNQEIARAGWCADYNEASGFLNTMLSDSSNNMSFYKNPEFDGLMAQALQAKTEQERTVIYQKAQALLDKDSVIAPVFYQSTSRLIKPYVGGYTGKNPLDYIYSKDLYIIKH